MPVSERLDLGEELSRIGVRAQSVRERSVALRGRGLEHPTGRLTFGKEVEMARDEEMVVVMETSDPGLLAVVKSVLESAGIPFFAKGEFLQDLFGLGQMGGINPITGPVEIQVPGEEADRARDILMDLKAEGSGGG